MGGHFDYKQYHINEIVELIEFELNNQGQEKPTYEELYGKFYFDSHKQKEYYPIYSNDIQNIMKDAISQIKSALVYINNIDDFLSGDTSEDDCIERIKIETIENIINEQ